MFWWPCGWISVCLRASLFVTICKPVEKSLNCKWPPRQRRECFGFNKMWPSYISEDSRLTLYNKSLKSKRHLSLKFISSFYFCPMYHFLPEVIPLTWSHFLFISVGGCAWQLLPWVNWHNCGRRWRTSRTRLQLVSPVLTIHSTHVPIKPV